MMSIDRNMSARPRRSGGNRAFSLLEMLVASAILVIIMLGLLGMFYQTDRALRLSFQQRDILDAGRTAMEIMVRDLSMMTAAGDTNFANFYVFSHNPNLEMVQELNESNPLELRTNALQQFFFLTKNNDIWNGVRYDFDQQNGVGILYRTSLDRWVDEQDPTKELVMTDPYAGLVSSNLFWTDIPTSRNNYRYNMQYGRIAEGIVHLALRCFDARGYLIDQLPFAFVDQNFIQYVFTGTNMPAYVELEFGVLEPKIYRQASRMSTPAEAKAFLRDKAGAVQLFRERIPVRYVPPALPSTTENF